MPRRFLFLHGGPEEARRVFREERRGYWAAALPVVLEKHGLTSFEESTVAGLEEALRRDEVGAVLVARTAARAETTGVLHRLRRLGIPLLIEGPLPCELHELAGIVSAEPTAAEGAVAITSRQLASAAAEYGYPAGARITVPAVRPVERESGTDWRHLDVPIRADQAEAWRRAGWDAERWGVDADAEVLATWTGADGVPSPALVRKGSVVAASFGLFSILGQAHTAEPWDHGEYRTSARITGLETLLLSLVDHLHRDADLVRPRILSWPRNARWVLNVRHDFDRFLASKAVAQTLARHQEAGSAATWYWRSRHLRDGVFYRRWPGNLAVKLVASSPGHEVALHTEQLWNGRAERERRVVERVYGRQVLGSSSHGDPHCFRFQGAPNVIWAERQGLLYTELIQHGHHQPHRFATLNEDGTIAALSVIALPHHESLDRTVAHDDADVAGIVQAGDRFARAGGLLQVLNHPDLNRDQLFEAIDGLPRPGRLDWTAARAADWWRRTHVRDRLRISPVSARSFDVTARERVEDLAVELLDPGGGRQVKLLRLEPGERKRIELSSVVASS